VTAELGADTAPTHSTPMRLDGKVAVVTGAGRGIGRACALALAAAGADVVAISRSRDELEAVAGEVDGLGRRGTALVCDVTDTARTRAALESLERIDVLVGSAGANIPEPFLDVSEEHLEALLALNVKATFLAAQAAARRMVESGEGGSIVTISSQMGHVGAANRTVYCTTKHAVEGMTKAMAVELAPHRIRVNSVAPTFVTTPMTAPFFADPEFRADVERRIPLGRIGTVEDVTGAVVYLASPAAALVTGTSLLVDGGWTAQ
jgi:NAD(P)-dependent dehydrogenase (short-subunit alcohol dehydrogenase family)